MISVVGFAIRDGTGGPRFYKVFFDCDILTTTGSTLVNVYCTSLIIVRLWRIGRRTHTHEGRSLYNHVIFSVVQSGALYTVTVILFASISLMGYYGVTIFMKFIVIMVMAIGPLLIVKQLQEKIPSEPNVTDALSVEGGTPDAYNRTLRFDARFRPTNRENNKPPKVGRVVLCPIDSVQLKSVHPSSGTRTSETRTSVSGRVSKNKQHILVTVPTLSNSDDHLRLRLEEGADIERGEGEEAEVSPLPSPKFAMDLECFPVDERSQSTTDT
ncbi:hypothetical protein FRB95_014348 [Tulasnella sp. JGI-2019a]|nr:hypothetical protein FRB95_014348 [Tulasnella sp. JGI-2019a]